MLLGFVFSIAAIFNHLVLILIGAFYPSAPSNPYLALLTMLSLYTLVPAFAERGQIWGNNSDPRAKKVHLATFWGAGLGMGLISVVVMKLVQYWEGEWGGFMSLLLSAGAVWLGLSTLLSIGSGFVGVSRNRTSPPTPSPQREPPGGG